MARAVTARRSLRSRLLLAFVAVAVPPVLVLALAVNALLGRSFDATTRERLDRSLVAVRGEVEARRARAREAVAQVAAVDLPAEEARDAREAGLASRAAGIRDLQALEIVGSDGRILSSHHWPAGFGLADRDGTFAGDETFRWETAAVGYGSEERLAATAQAASAWRGRLVVVRGGPFLDAAFCEGLSKLAGVEVAIRDVRRRRWIAPAGVHIASWDAPAFAEGAGGVARGDAPTDGGNERWAALPLHADLWIVVATPQAALARIQGDVRSLGLAVAAAVLVGALAAALVLSSRIARPVTALAGRARALAAGETPEIPSPAGSDEIGDLSRAFTDLTAELEASRERLLQAERVAAWREMARRLAHELKNPIFPIQLSIETLRRALAQDGQAGRFGELFRESSDTVLDELRALRGIIDEFSDFARMPQPRLVPTDVAEVVAHVTDLYRARAGEVVLETAIADGLPPAAADREMLARALGNLVGNALDAMPDGGTLRVAAAPQDGGVSIEVSDTGPGLTDEQRTRLFTPYFTTKKGGTGLGLAIVQGIVSDHGGRIRVESEPGRGTTFTLLLPRMDT
ncbi:MAG: ATP-binding protein [Vicinamibacteria bacterium]